MAALLALCAPQGARAQASVSALPVQGLRFGTLSPGLATVVSPDDGGRRASLELVGSGSVTVTFQLPREMEAPDGKRLPLRFGPTDGRIVFPRSTREIVFDPSAPVSFSIPPGSGGATLYLGGAAEPGPRQPPGAYTTSITAWVVVANAAT